MTEARRQELSILMDDELDPKDIGRLVNDVCGERELRETWNRYHLIGDALRGEPLNLEATRLADQVRRQLAAEPALLPVPHRRSHRRWAVPIAGSALAASLAMVAWVVGPAYFGDAPATSVPVRALASAPIATPNLYLQRSGTSWNVQQPEVENTLNRYLVNHQAYSPSSGMKGMLPYASFASYDARR
jgi:sigma-E factor negative regulatory protein RseA